MILPPPPPPPPPRFSSTLAANIFKFIFPALLIALAFTLTYTSSSDAFSESDLRNILTLGGAVNAVLLLGALLLQLRSKIIANAALTLVVLAGAATAYIIHTDLYLTGNRFVLVLFCLGLALGLFVAFRAIDEMRWAGIALSAAALLALAIVAGGRLATGSDTVEGDVSNIRHITFQETPNLYFVSFESMAPRSLLDKYLDIETTEFHEVFDANFRRFSNFFADSVGTTHSLNTVLALDVSVYSSQRRDLEERGYNPNPFLFAGQNPSPLLGILRKNGYETTTINTDFYLGKRKGRYVDNYITLEQNTVCNLLDPNIREWAFWRYCHYFDDKYDSDNRLIAERITKVSGNGGPQFVMVHLYVPGHVNTKSFRYGNAEQLEKFKSRYLIKSEEAAQHLDLIIQHLKVNDPNAILLVYGDHGVLQSYELDVKDNPEFVIQDHYGILGGVYPRDACAAWFDDASSQGYMTILDAVHTLLRCLSGGESALIKPNEEPIHRYGPMGVKHDYKEFLYE